MFLYVRMPQGMDSTEEPKISETKLPFSYIFCPLNNTFQKIPFWHLHWAKRSQQRALSGATQAQLSLTLCVVPGTETGCSL